MKGSHYKIIESAYDPNHPWQLIETAPDGKGMSSTGFRTYGEAWREVERRKIAESEMQDNDMFAHRLPAPAPCSQKDNPS